MSVEKALFSILQQELGGKPCPRSYLDQPLRPAVLALAEKHDLGHILAHAYANAGLLGKDELSEACRKAYMLAFYRSQQQSYVLDQVCNTFDRLGIDCIPLKGAVIRRYYPETWMRSSSDVDVLIRREDAQKALECLQNLDYRLHKSTSGYDYSLYSSQGVHLELHFSLTQMRSMKKVNALLTRAWEYALPQRRELTGEMFTVYHIAHMAKHFIKGGCGIRPFMDLWLLRGNMDIDHRILEALLQEAGLYEFYQAVNETVDVWFENKPHSSITAGIQEFVLTGGVYGTRANAYAVRAARGEGRLKSFGRLMFVSRANLEYLYPRLERHPWLLPYYQVKRWFGFFDKTRRNNLKQLTDTRSAVTKAQVITTGDLLDQLGLSE